MKFLNNKQYNILTKYFLKSFNYKQSKIICTNCQFNEKNYDNKNKKKQFFIIASLTCYCTFHFLANDRKLCAENQAQLTEPGQFIPNLPNYTVDEVAKHNDAKSQIWVIYKKGVYDITSFVTYHPGGNKILLAAGKSIEPFWKLYSVHNSEEIYSLLEEMRIGNLKDDEKLTVFKDLEDPYHNDPERHPILVPVSIKPFNAECPSDVLINHFITPNEIFFVRNHLPVPIIDPKDYKLEICIENDDKRKLVFNLDRLKQYPKHSVMATIMCAGNRRSEMVKVKPVKGLEWKEAAVGNAVWSGALLRDVLLDLGINENDVKFQHVQFEGYDKDVTNQSYGASIPFWRAVDKRCETILAYEMNGEPIPYDHGFPVRVIIPGIVGARNVKWLARIVLSANESSSHWQQNDYKGFSPSTDWDTVDFKKSPSIQELPVISAVCSPRHGDTVDVFDGYITVKGYAWSGGGHAIIRVDVTSDGGKTWHTATFDNQSTKSPPQHFSWTLWSVEIPVNENNDKIEIWAKAVDSNYNVQPESFENIWNLRGVLNNAYHRIQIILNHE